MHVVLGFSSERRLGDLEVALTLEDLGPIVQPTVQLEAAEEKVVSWLRISYHIIFVMIYSCTETCSNRMK